ncbi:glycosyltransferase family 2 protein [Wukongibacter sp. M2B1]|uniref:glycosyltransferase family 2 protein n=1 Tax=Wukongibacter sp. M2B1 TaxID=3088895 RepID=UPI003D7B1051
MSSIRLKNNITKKRLSKTKVRVLPRGPKIEYAFKPGISIITTTMRLDYIDNIFDNYSRQNYKNKELVIALHNNKIDIDRFKERAKEYKNINIFRCDEKMNFGECKNLAFKQTKLDYIAIFDDDDYYAPNYLKQSIAPFSFTTCDIVGKRTCFMYFEDRKKLGIFAPNNENRFVKNVYVMDSSMIIKREVLENISFPITSHPAEVLTRFQDACFKNSVKVYSTNRFDYVVHRRNPSTHTWSISDDTMLKWCQIIKEDVTNYTKYIELL